MAYRIATPWEVQPIDLHGWMQKVADQRQCSSYKSRNGEVFEVVFREDRL